MAMKTKIVFVFLFLPCMFLCLPTEADDIRFDHISLNEGLSQSIVSCIIQDHNGFMWFATENGLNKFDGYSFTVFRRIQNNPQSLNQNEILNYRES